VPSLQAAVPERTDRRCKGIHRHLAGAHKIEHRVEDVRVPERAENAQLTGHYETRRKFYRGRLCTDLNDRASIRSITLRGIQPEALSFVHGNLVVRLPHNVDLVDLDLQERFGRCLVQSGSLRRVAPVTPGTRSSPHRRGG